MSKWKFYFIKTSDTLIRCNDKDCESWFKESQQWKEESFSFLHDMISKGCVMELQEPFRGGSVCQELG